MSVVRNRGFPALDTPCSRSTDPLWFKDRVSRNGGRLKKTTVVALARKLLIALWKRRRHRGRHCEERLKGDQKRLKQSTGTRSVSADPGGRT
jgi:hypothetical protein